MSLTTRSVSSRKVIYAAIASNLAMRVQILSGGRYGKRRHVGRSIPLHRGFRHELLLLWGMRRSARTPDSLHPFGHGKVIYFYSLLVTVYILGIGGILAVRQGVIRLRQPDQFTHVGWNRIVLIAAFALDFYSWRVSYK